MRTTVNTRVLLASSLLVGALAVAAPSAGAVGTAVRHSSVKSAIVIPKSTTVASLTAPTWGYRVPGGKRTRLVSNRWLGAPVITPVVARKGNWIEIRLPMRPNSSTIWIQTNRVLLSATPYFIEVNVTTTHLRLYKAGKLVLNAPAGVGVSADPTPTGHFYAMFFTKPDGPGYGPWLLMTSAHSTTISNWSGTGDALVAIHGALFADAQIGTKGGYVSHGCIRLHEADQLKLGSVTDGTPITIVR